MEKDAKRDATEATSETPTESEVEFVASFIKYATEVPAMAQSKLSAFAELTAKTGKIVDEAKKAMERFAGIDDKASMESFDALTAINLLMEESKALQQEKNLIAAEICEIVTNRSEEVISKSKELMGTEEKELKVEDVVDKKARKIKLSLRSRKEKGRVKDDKTKVSSLVRSKPVSIKIDNADEHPIKFDQDNTKLLFERSVPSLAKNARGDKESVKEVDAMRQAKKPFHFQQQKLASLSQSRITKWLQRPVSKSPNIKQISGSSSVSSKQSPRSKKRLVAKNRKINGKKINLEMEDQEGEASEEVYCFCQEEAHGDMVACDGIFCEREWFHYECVGLLQAPPKNEKWFCDECKKN